MKSLKPRFALPVALAVALGALAFGAFQNCAPAGGGAAQHGSSVAQVTSGIEVSSNIDTANLQTQLQSLIQSDLSCQSDADCSALPVGAKSCGGPERYEIVSNNNAAMNQIKYIAAEITASQEAAQQSTGSVSTCSIVAEPTASCVNNACQ